MFVPPEDRHTESHLLFQEPVFPLMYGSCHSAGSAPLGAFSPIWFLCALPCTF